MLCYKQKTAYGRRISDWSSDVCSSDLRAQAGLEERDAKLDIERKKLGVEDAMVGAAGLSLSQLVKLGKAGLRTVEDVAGLTPDELRFVMMDVESEVKLDDLFALPDHEIGRRVRQCPLSADEANAIILAARVLLHRQSTRQNSSHYY